MVRPGNGRRSLWLFPFLLLLTVRGAELGPAEYRGIAQVVGSVALLATFPGVVRALVEGLGQAMSSVSGCAHSLGGAVLLAGRRIVAEPAVVSQPLSALAMAVVMAAQVQLWAGAVGDTTQASLDSRQALSSRVLLVDPSASRTRTAAFERALPDEALPMGLIVSGDGRRVEIVGSCPALRETRLCDERVRSSATGTRRVGYAAADPRLRALLAAIVPADVPVYARVADVPEALARAGTAGDHGQLLLVGAGDRRLPVAALSRIAHRELAMKGSVRMIGDEWVWGAASKVTAGRWARLLSLIGLAAVATTVVFHRRLRRAWPGGRWEAWWYVVPAGVTVMVLAAVMAWWLAAPVNSVSAPGPAAMAMVLGPATLLLMIAALSRGCAARPLPVSPEPRAEQERATV